MRRGIFPGLARIPRPAREAPPGVALEAAPPTQPGWVSFATWKEQGEGAVHSLSGSWTVPQPPQQDLEQTLFVHLALQNTSSPYVILTAALQWGESSAGGGSYWALSCFIAKGNDVWTGPLVEVSAGDPVEAELRRFVQMDVPIWECALRSGGRETSLRGAFMDDEPELSLVYGGVLEAYSERQMSCSEYPDAELTPITALRLTGADGQPLEPSWKSEVEVPGCGRKVEVVSPAQVDLYYR